MYPCQGWMVLLSFFFFFGSCIMTERLKRYPFKFFFSSVPVKSVICRFEREKKSIKSIYRLTLFINSMQVCMGVFSRFSSNSFSHFEEKKSQIDFLRVCAFFLALVSIWTGLMLVSFTYIYDCKQFTSFDMVDKRSSAFCPSAHTSPNSHLIWPFQLFYLIFIWNVNWKWLCMCVCASFYYQISFPFFTYPPSHLTVHSPICTIPIFFILNYILFSGTKKNQIK